MPYAKIKTTQATLTLDQLHRELAGKILDNKAEARRLVQSMKHVEAVLKLLDPAYNVGRIAVRRRKPNPWFKRGTLFRSAVGVLRTAEKPLSAKEIAHYPDGTTKRYYVGRSSGWMPCHIEVNNSRSHGGGPVYWPEGTTFRKLYRKA